MEIEVLFNNLIQVSSTLGIFKQNQNSKMECIICIIVFFINIICLSFLCLSNWKDLGL